MHNPECLQGNSYIECTTTQPNGNRGGWKKNSALLDEFQRLKRGLTPRGGVGRCISLHAHYFCCIIVAMFQV